MDGNDARTTLDRLNAELAIFDRPLEDDVEYYDDPPPRRLWQRIGATLGAFTLLGAVAGFAVTHWSSPAAATEVSPRAPLAAPAPVALPPSAPPAAVPAAVAETDDEAAPDTAPDLAPAVGPARSRGDWTILQPAGSRHQHGRAHHHHHHHHGAGR